MAEQSILTVWNPETQQYESVEGADGAIKVTGVDGGEVASESTLAAIKADTATLAGTVLVGAPTAEFPASAVVIKSAPVLSVEIVAGQTATATPATDAERIVVGVVDLPPAIPVGESGTALPVTVLGTATIAGEVSQGRGTSPDTADPWIVATSDGVIAKQLATKEGQDTTIAAVQAVEVELQDKATEAKQDATIAEVDEVEEKLGTLTAQEATTAKDATLTNGTQIALADIRVGGIGVSNANPVPIVAALGTALSVARGTAGVVATQLPNTAYAKGFTLKNISMAIPIYIGPTNAVTPATGFPIDAGDAEPIPLSNSNLVWVITAAGTADWAIGGT